MHSVFHTLRRARARTAILWLAAWTLAGCAGDGNPLTGTGRINRSVGGTAELEGITATSSPQCPWGYGGTPPDCVPAGGWIPSGSSPGAGFGGSGAEGTGESSSPSGNQNGDGETPDDGVGAFAVCVAAKMGTAGWASILATGISAWQLYEVRQQTRNSYNAWQLYHDGRPNNPEWDPAVENLFWANFQNAESAEQALWATTAATSGTTLILIGEAMVACLPTLAVPEP